MRKHLILFGDCQYDLQRRCHKLILRKRRLLSDDKVREKTLKEEHVTREEREMFIYFFNKYL